jgi:hypothetical protein
MSFPWHTLSTTGVMLRERCRSAGAVALVGRHLYAHSIRNSSRIGAPGGSARQPAAAQLFGGRTQPAAAAPFEVRA